MKQGLVEQDMYREQEHSHLGGLIQGERTSQVEGWVCARTVGRGVLPVLGQWGGLVARALW